MQQYNAPAYHANEAVEMLHKEMLNFISLDFWPQNSPDFNPVDCQLWPPCRNVLSYKHPPQWWWFETAADLVLMQTLTRSLSISLLTVWKEYGHTLEWRVIISSTSCELTVAVYDFVLYDWLAQILCTLLKKSIKTLISSVLWFCQVRAAQLRWSVDFIPSIWADHFWLEWCWSC